MNEITITSDDANLIPHPIFIFFSIFDCRVSYLLLWKDLNASSCGSSFKYLTDYVSAYITF